MSNYTIKKDAWIASSSLQKNERRGCLNQALHAVDILLEQAPDRFWRRISVIALEDVSIGDLDIVRKALLMAGRKAVRTGGGGERENALHITELLCRALKFRGCCDLAVIADLAPEYRQTRIDFADLSQNELADILIGAGSLPVRLLAAWYLAGTTRFPGVNLHPREGSPRLLLEVFETLGLPPEIIEIVGLGMARMREPHPLALPLIWLSATTAGDCRIETNNLKPSPTVAGWPAYALDMHTRPGRKAIELFGRRCEPLRRLVEQQLPPSARPDFLGSLVFRAEGALVDRRLLYKGANELLHAATIAQLTHTGMPQNLAMEALEVTRQHLELLHSCRLEIAGAGR